MDEELLTFQPKWICLFGLHVCLNSSYIILILLHLTLKIFDFFCNNEDEEMEMKNYSILSNLMIVELT